ncbi:hypothetical protein DET47_12019 [Shewanella putrefaciens]|nr:hypothetical protein DET47_12019 [Shewanella putrefaciens]
MNNQEKIARYLWLLGVPMLVVTLASYEGFEFLDYKSLPNFLGEKVNRMPEPWCTILHYIGMSSCLVIVWLTWRSREYGVRLVVSIITKAKDLVINAHKSV